MSHELTLNCLLKLESTIVNINLAIKSSPLGYFIKLSTRLYRSYTCTYNSMCDLWLENLQIYIISLYYQPQILPDYIHTKYIHVL